MYLEVKSDSEQHAGTAADPEATEEEQPSARGLHDEHLVGEAKSSRLLSPSR